MNVASIFDRYKITIIDGKCVDPIRGIFVKATPEEIVRQKTIRFLMKRLGVPQNRIIVEKTLNSLGVFGNRKRIDIGILDDEDRMKGVVECKASLLKIDELAHVQAVDYLRSLNVRYFFVTDGVLFYGYYLDPVQFVRLETIPVYDLLLEQAGKKSVDNNYKATGFEKESKYGQ